MSEIVFAVLTISDTCHQDSSKDRSGPRLVQLLKDSFAKPLVFKEIIPDDRDLIENRLRQLSREDVGISAIFTTGGTGFAPRDVTPEATKQVLDKDCSQLSMAIALHSLEKTKFAALSRGVCGIAGKTLILNFPGSEKAVVECFEYVKDLLPHALHLLNNDSALVLQTHKDLQEDQGVHLHHSCPHKTNTGADADRNSPFPMIQVNDALHIIMKTIRPQKNLKKFLLEFESPVDIPPFKASIKDGYAMKSSGFSGSKKVLGYIAAGDPIFATDLEEDECFKINTGAPLPEHTDCVIQVEDTKLLRCKKDGSEDLVEILVEPKKDLDVRSSGYDLAKNSKLFPSLDFSPVVINSLLASVGESTLLTKPSIAVISTGNELLSPQQPAQSNKIYDSNTTLLQELLQYFNFPAQITQVLSDDFDEVFETLAQMFKKVDFIISSGGVSMGDKDYIKPVLAKLGFQIHVGRVNMKPGKPMTFASKESKYFFGLPGNPVSAFATFHLFVLPALRWFNGWPYGKCMLPIIEVILDNDKLSLDPRPEYMRASITSKSGRLHASITGNQISSRLQSIVGADVLVHLPAHAEDKPDAKKGDILLASVLRYDFITKYE
ncbi:molybdenum cofactor synthesis protein cinnamon [Glossina fuscipes]|uniref:Molybdenum cofactor synthesis protein cinnamon n=1 Tax=Glossina fuscipes TaxID=7396 RepID=A0A9C5YXM9_9MUSC|nr:molybdenum cofactor synthesis protein cinnamon [Glossina fuscipes]